MPFPSAGCQTCKARRIKCDEAQPVCQRCMKSKKTCYGMRAGQACSIIHIENSYASGQKKRPRGPRSTPTVELTGDPGAVMQRSLHDLKKQAIAYYLNYHLQALKDAPNASKGVSDYFLPTWMTRAECPILDLAMSSLALAVFSRTQQHPPAAIEASKRYHRLLQIAQVTILSLDEQNIDTCLLANFFMSRYEDVVHRPCGLNLKSPFATALQSFSHHDGGLAILKFWKHHLSHRQPATDVIKHTRRGMIRSAIMRYLALPDWMLEGSTFGEHGLELEYDCIVVQISSVRQRLSALLREKTGPQRTSSELTSTTEELDKEVRDLDKALLVWTTHFPSTWSYQRHILSKPYPWPMRDFYSPVVSSYSSVAYAAVWNQYYATRMLINSTRLRVLESSRPSSDEFVYQQRLECFSHIEAMANELASSVPFCLQRFKVNDDPVSPYNRGSTMLNTNEEILPYMASMIIWPLTIASSLGNVDAKKRLWFRSELARLGRVVGAGVIECAETEPWLEL